MRYGQIRKFDIANGPGIRTSVFVVGCSLKCPGCFNVEYQSWQAGKEWTKKEEEKVLKHLCLPYVSGLSILGGEPLEQDESLLDFLKTVKKKVKKSVWMWSGFCYENLNEKQREVIKYVDVLVDGPFIEKNKDLRLQFKGSTNQRIIDLNETRKKTKLQLWVNYDRKFDII